MAQEDSKQTGNGNFVEMENYRAKEKVDYLQRSSACSGKFLFDLQAHGNRLNRKIWAKWEAPLKSLFAGKSW